VHAVVVLTPPGAKKPALHVHCDELPDETLPARHDRHTEAPCRLYVFGAHAKQNEGERVISM
jgi:hypothetical protein